MPLKIFWAPNSIALGSIKGADEARLGKSYYGRNRTNDRAHFGQHDGDINRIARNKHNYVLRIFFAPDENVKQVLAENNYFLETVIITISLSLCLPEVIFDRNHSITLKQVNHSCSNYI